MKIERTLESIEDTLTVWHRVSTWLDQLERFDSLSAYAREALRTVETRDPARDILYRARRQLRKKSTAFGRSQDLEVCESLRQALLFQTLHLATNGEVQALIDANHARLDAVRLTIEMLECFCHADAEREGAKRFAIQAQATLIEILTDCRSARLAMESLAKRFFQGRDIFFSSIARGLDELFRSAQLCVETISPYLTEDQRAAPVGFQVSQEDVERGSEVMINNVLDFARATVALRFGDMSQALEAAAPHLDGQQAQKTQASQTSGSE